MTVTAQSAPAPLAPTAAPRRRTSGRPVWEEEPSRAGRGLKGATLAGVCLAILGPLWVVVTSLSDQKAITGAGGLVIVPQTITFRAYSELLGGGTVTRAAIVSLALTAVGTVISTVVSILCAYGLSRRGSFLHRPILMVLLVTMFFNAGLIPTYLLVTGVGLEGSYWSMILPGAISLFYAVGDWSQWFNAMLYLNDQDMWPIKG